MNSIEVFTLDNGIRVVCAPSVTDVVYCGVAVGAGTRDELQGEEGMAHFTEHLSFKGTTRRKSWHILNRMESVGGDLNAFTGKEETVYYCTFLKQHFARAIDLLMDVVLNSIFPASEMEKEVEVVIDEIESYNDSPSDLIYDEFENILFQGHPLGHNILGEAEGLRKMTSQDIQRFAHRLYRPDNMVVFVKGNVPAKTILRELNKALANVVSEGRNVHHNTSLSVDSTFVGADSTFVGIDPVSAGASSCRTHLLPPYHPVTITKKKDTHQAHVMMGCRAYSALDKHHLPLYFLSNILGGPGMNSRLNLALRERNGLVYTVESSYTTYTDTGVWCVYFGCDPSDVERCKRLVLHELHRLASAPLSASQLSAAKRQIKGQIGISYDSFENVAIGMGKRMLHYNQTQTYESLCQKIEALTAEEIYETARELFVPEQLTTLVYL